MIKTYAPFGYEGQIVDIEVDLRRGIPALDIVGLSDASVKETRERARAAINNSGLEIWPERTLVSFSPADLKKEGAGYDLPLALALIAEHKLFSAPDCEKGVKENYPDVLVIGELELSGKVRPVKGVYAALEDAVDAGIKYAIIPEDNKNEVPYGIEVHFASDLNDALNAFLSPGSEDYYEKWEKVEEDKEVHFARPSHDGISFDEIEGHNGLKFAMAVAAAGRHSLLAVGAPGSGKTTCLQHFPDLMPLLTSEEKESVDRIRSLAGLTYFMKGEERAWERPFRIPHQTASIEGICGGGPTCRPGEITLAHNGVLFLDEAAEFRSSVLHMLRVPMEKQSLTLSRAGRMTTYPAHFQLLMAANPCPCGNYGSKDKICLCSAKSVDQYWKKFSAPLLDLVAIRFYDDKEHNAEWKPATLEEYREMIARAWIHRKERGNEGLKIAPDADKLYESEAEKRNWSPRARSLILSVAVTISDMFDYSEVSIQAMRVAIKLHEIGPDMQCASTL